MRQADSWCRPANSIHRLSGRPKPSDCVSVDLKTANTPVVRTSGWCVQCRAPGDESGALLILNPEEVVIVAQKQTGYSIYAVYATPNDGGEEELIVASIDLKLVSKAYNDLVYDMEFGESKYGDARIEA